MDHILCRIGADRFASSPGCKVSSSVLLPALMLTANLGDLGAAVPLVDRAERCARFDRLQLLRVANEDDLGAGIGGVADHALHLPRANHARFVDDEHVARGQQVTPLRPAMFEARSEEHTSELQSLMSISDAVIRLKK